MQYLSNLSTGQLPKRVLNKRCFAFALLINLSFHKKSHGDSSSTAQHNLRHPSEVRAKRMNESLLIKVPSKSNKAILFMFNILILEKHQSQSYTFLLFCQR